MNICLCITNFKNDLVEAISKTAIDFALLLNINKRVTCVLYTPGTIAANESRKMALENVSFTTSRDYHSKIRVLWNIIALGHYLRSDSRNFDIFHFHAGNLLEMFLIRMFLPKLSGTKVITVWQPYLGVVESFRLPWSFRNQIGGILHHYLFNSWPLIPLFWLGAGYFDRIVVHTTHQKAQLFFIPKRKIRLIENGVPAPQKTIRREKSYPPGVLYVGHATAVKGLDVLLSALCRARRQTEFRVTLALTEFQNIDVERLVALNGLEDIVTIKGHVDVLDEFLRHDVLVIPHKVSVGTSCYPNIALEAFSVGISIIASATDVLREIIDDRITGFLVPPGDVIRLEQALVKLFNAPQDTEKMAKSQQDVFNRRFFIDRYVERHLQIYEELSSPRPPTNRAGDSGRHS